MNANIYWAGCQALFNPLHTLTHLIYTMTLWGRSHSNPIHPCGHWDFSRVQLFCDPTDCSPPGSSVHEISQARMLEWVSFSSSGDLSHPGIEPASPALAGRFFTTEAPGKSIITVLPLFIFFLKAFHIDHWKFSDWFLGLFEMSLFLFFNHFLISWHHKMIWVYILFYLPQRLPK